MRPITDDVVLGLMKGLEKREKRALAKRASLDAAGMAPGSMTSRVFNFVGGTNRTDRSEGIGANVASLEAAARSRKERRISRGLFSYMKTN